MPLEDLYAWVGIASPAVVLLALTITFYVKDKLSKSDDEDIIA